MTSTRKNRATYYKAENDLISSCYSRINRFLVFKLEPRFENKFCLISFKCHNTFLPKLCDAEHWCTENLTHVLWEKVCIKSA